MAQRKTGNKNLLLFIIIFVAIILVVGISIKNGLDKSSKLASTALEKTVTTSQNGVQISINPTQGKTGTQVHVKISGITPNSKDPFGGLTFKTGVGVMPLGSSINTATLDGEVYEGEFIIPSKVYGISTIVTKEPSTSVAPGTAYVNFSYLHPNLGLTSVTIPFMVTSN